MDPKKLRSAMMSMYGDDDADQHGGPSDADHDDAAVAEMSGSGRGGDQLAGLGIRDMPEFHHDQTGPKGPFVDRIEGDTATLLMPDGETREVPASKLPRGTREGAYLGPDGVDDLLGTMNTNNRIREHLLQLNGGDDGSDIKL